MAVWVTRSAPDNLRTARGLRSLGRKPLIVPVLATVRRHQASLAVLPDAIVFTSLHALRHFAGRDGTLALPVFAASGVVANAAASLGYASVTSTADDDDMLARLMGHSLPAGAKVLIVCADRTFTSLQDRLEGFGLQVWRQVVYELAPVDDGSLAVATASLDRIAGIVLHSHVCAQRILPLLARAHWRGTLWCISRRTASACDDLPGATVCRAARPTERSLMAMIADAATTGLSSHSRTSAVDPETWRMSAPARPASDRSVGSNDNAASSACPEDDSDPTAA